MIWWGNSFAIDQFILRDLNAFIKHTFYYSKDTTQLDHACHAAVICRQPFDNNDKMIG